VGDVTVPVTAIGEAGRMAAAVASDVSGIDVAGPAGEIATALPGSRSAQVAAAAAQQWRVELTGVTTAMQDYGRDLADTATEYRHAEAAQLQQIAAVLPGPAALLAGAPSLIRQALG
jgi:hypothetical protein